MAINIDYKRDDIRNQQYWPTGRRKAYWEAQYPSWGYDSVVVTSITLQSLTHLTSPSIISHILEADGHSLSLSVGTVRPHGDYTPTTVVLGRDSRPLGFIPVGGGCRELFDRYIWRKISCTLVPLFILTHFSPWAGPVVGASDTLSLPPTRCLSLLHSGRYASHFPTPLLNVFLLISWRWRNGQHQRINSIFCGWLL